MNLISCSNDCIYQKDGSCTLDIPAKITSLKEDCCYFSNDKSQLKEGGLPAMDKNDLYF